MPKPVAGHRPQRAVTVARPSVNRSILCAYRKPMEISKSANLHFVHRPPILFLLHAVFQQSQCVKPSIVSVLREHLGVTRSAPLCFAATLHPHLRLQQFRVFRRILSPRQSSPPYLRILCPRSAAISGKNRARRVLQRVCYLIWNHRMCVRRWRALHLQCLRTMTMNAAMRQSQTVPPRLLSVW
jgi:hypothetical protein